ncbi:hypothetical protein AF335_09415 [Streptomyces eurocidicus]|uniref:Uncharacterized protein n=1 Tax=Streptomyces eurocidicus TaxID=66423 RepID=A0A2N8P133_STREU|nr:hypothetical protein AF335_09415 [Streptomyces eurocidicus]
MVRSGGGLAVEHGLDQREAALTVRGGGAGERPVQLLGRGDAGGDRAVPGTEGGGQGGVVPCGDVVVGGLGAVDGAFDGVTVVVQHDHYGCGAVTCGGSDGLGGELGAQGVADRVPQGLADEPRTGGQAQLLGAEGGGADVGDQDVAGLQLGGQPLPQGRLGETGAGRRGRRRSGTGGRVFA